MPEAGKEATWKTSSRTRFPTQTILRFIEPGFPLAATAGPAPANPGCSTDRSTRMATRRDDAAIFPFRNLDIRKRAFRLTRDEMCSLPLVMAQLSKRHSEILDILSRRGYAAIEELAAAFNVTPQTLRRDLQDLSDRGYLRRHHGGASANLSTVNADYDFRHVETASEKAAIGRAAAELVKPGSSVFLTPGTTIDALAKAIAERAISGLRV